MKRKRVIKSFRFQKKTIDDFKKLGYSERDGLERAAQFYISLRKSAIKELNAYFSKDEIHQFLKAQKDQELNLTLQFSAEFYIQFLETRMAEDNKISFISKENF